MKKFFLCAVLACGLASFAADPYFEQAMKHVDTGGEALVYQNVSTITAELDKTLPDIIVGFCKNEKQAVLANDISRCFLKMVDLSSIKAIAGSSKKVAPEVFVAKEAVIFAPDSKSILTSPGVTNHQLDWQELPANTRLAFAMDLNMSYRWSRIKSELIASGNADILKIVQQINELKKEGIDLDVILANANGIFSLQITGNNLTDLNVKLTISDKNNFFKDKLQTICPPAANSNVFEKKLSDRTLQVVYAEKEIIFVSDPALLAAPAQKLGSLPQFREYAKHLPSQGYGYVIVNIPQHVADFINLIDPKLNLGLKQFSLVAVCGKIANGESSAAASNYSLRDLQIMWFFKHVKMLQQARKFHKNK